MNPAAKLLALRFLLDGARVALSTSDGAFVEAKGCGYRSFTPDLERDWQIDAGTATLKVPPFLFPEDGDVTVRQVVLVRPDPYTGDMVTIAGAAVKGGPARVRVAKSSIEVPPITVRLE